MRRRRGQDEQHPPRLLTYRAEDWPDADCHPECAFWAAVFAYLETHPGAEVVGPDLPWHEGEI